MYNAESTSRTLETFIMATELRKWQKGVKKLVDDDSSEIYQKVLEIMSWVQNLENFRKG